MPQVAIYDVDGARAAEIDVPEELLGLPFNADLIHQAVVAADYGMKRRCGRAKVRSEVSLSKAKWYRQKGLGRARHGARSAPTFVGGGKAHGPTGEQPTQKMPKKMRRKALFVALSERLRDGSLTVVDEMQMDEVSTKQFVGILGALGLEGNVLMLLTADQAKDETLYKSCRNVTGLIAREVPHFNTREVVWADDVVITRAALQQLMEGGTKDAE